MNVVFPNSFLILGAKFGAKFGAEFGTEFGAGFGAEIGSMFLVSSRDTIYSFFERMQTCIDYSQV